LFNKSETEKTNFRYNLLTTVVYIVGIILLMQLFNLQIIHGKEYRETSNTKLSKEAIVKAARGKILDRTGTILAETQMGFNVKLFKTKASTDEVNNSMIVLSEILEKNGDKYSDDFPISIEPFQYNFSSEEALNKWKEKHKIALEASPEEAFYVLKDKYEIKEGGKHAYLCRKRQGTVGSGRGSWNYQCCGKRSHRHRTAEDPGCSN